MSDGLFEMEPTPVAVGEEVVIQTMWGDEPATVRHVGVVDGFCMVTVLTRSGDRISVERGRVRQQH